MRRNERWAALGAAVLLTTGLTACDAGGGTDVASDPSTALSEAVEALADYDGIELLLTLDGDRDALAAAAGDDVDPETAELILTSSVLLRAAGEDQDDAQAEVIVSLGEQEALALRVLPGQELFFRVDLDAVSAAVDDPEFDAGLEEALGSADAFGLGELAAAVREGGWVQLTGAQQLAELAGGRTGGGEEPSEEEVADVRERIVAALQRFLDEDVDVAYVGEEDAGERVTATTTEGDLAALFDEISRIASDVSGVDPDAFSADLPEDVEGSDSPVELDFWLDGGELQQVGYDLSQAEGEEAPPEDTWILVSVDEFTGSVEAPDASTEVDLFAIIGSMFGGLGAPGAPGAVEDGADAGTDGGDPLGGECIPQEQLDELTGGDEAAQAELDQAIEMGLIEVC